MFLKLNVTFHAVVSTSEANPIQTMTPLLIRMRFTWFSIIEEQLRRTTKCFCGWKKLYDVLKFGCSPWKNVLKTQCHFSCNGVNIKSQPQVQP